MAAKRRTYISGCSGSLQPGVRAHVFVSVCVCSSVHVLAYVCFCVRVHMDIKGC